ncbi:MAG: hypothetical protein O2931_10115 [Planctomycetota bacterium]|nr:hypothetical protein [Planctomycetota bacterium]
MDRSFIREALGKNQVRNWTEWILQYTPGFQRREPSGGSARSFAEKRAWMLDRMELGKRGLNAYTRTFSDAEQFDSLVPWERIRNQIELLLARVRGLTGNYHGLRSAGKLSGDALQDLYDCEENLLDAVQNFSVALEEMSPGTAASAEPFQRHVAEVTRLLDQREALWKEHRR